MTLETAIGLLANPVRLRVFSAVALGATTPTAVATTAGTGPRATASALWRLKAGGLVTESDGRLSVGETHLKSLARDARRVDRSTEQFVTGDRRLDRVLGNFVREGRLIHLPGQLQRRREVLQHLALRSFEACRRYSEREVDDILRIWVEHGETDHVSLRRYLIELKLLDRAGGQYWLRDDI